MKIKEILSRIKALGYKAPKGQTEHSLSEEVAAFLALQGVGEEEMNESLVEAAIPEIVAHLGMTQAQQPGLAVPGQQPTGLGSAQPRPGINRLNQPLSPSEAIAQVAQRGQQEMNEFQTPILQAQERFVDHSAQVFVHQLRQTPAMFIERVNKYSGEVETDIETFRNAGTKFGATLFGGI